MSDEVEPVSFDLEGIESLAEPLGGESPTGEDPRFLEEYERIEGEIGKIGGVDQIPVDWYVVGGLAQKLLESTAKDLRCCCYLTIAAGRVFGIARFVDAVEVTGRMLARFGADLHPRRPKARLGVTLWFAEQVEAWLSEKTQELATAEHARLAAGFDQWSHALSAVEVDDVHVRSAAGNAKKLIGTVLSEGERREEVKRAFPDDLVDVGMAILAFVDASKEHSANTLRLRRWALWMTPPRPETLTVAEQQRPELEKLFKGRQWAELLERSETLLMKHPFWLDLAHYTFRAANGTLGEAAGAAVQGELRALLSRHPELPAARTSNGEDVASNDTRSWIERDVVGSSSEGSDASAASVRLPRELRHLMEEGRMRDALAQASPWVTERMGRVRLARSVALARGFSEFGAPHQAFMVFRGLHGQLRQITVKEWEPELFAACLEGYLATKRDAMGLGPEDEPLLEELSVLDPTAVMEVMSG